MKGQINDLQYYQAVKRIMSNEAGLYEKVIGHFLLNPGQAGILEILEERRKNGEFLKPTTNGQPNIKPGE